MYMGWVVHQAAPSDPCTCACAYVGTKSIELDPSRQLGVGLILPDEADAKEPNVEDHAQRKEREEHGDSVDEIERSAFEAGGVKRPAQVGERGSKLEELNGDGDVVAHACDRDAYGEGGGG